MNSLTAKIFDISLNKVTSNNFLDICTTEGATASDIFAKIDVITQNQIPWPWDKCVAFSVDNSSLNMGK